MMICSRSLHTPTHTLLLHPTSLDLFIYHILHTILIYRIYYILYSLYSPRLSKTLRMRYNLLILFVLDKILKITCIKKKSMFFWTQINRNMPLSGALQHFVIYLFGSLQPFVMSEKKVLSWQIWGDSSTAVSENRSETEGDIKEM